MTSANPCCDEMPISFDRALCRSGVALSDWRVSWARIAAALGARLRYGRRLRATERGLNDLDDRALREIGLAPTPQRRASRGFRIE